MKSIVEHILEGDASAVETFYQTYSPGILAYLKQKLPRHEDAQELLNDVFLDAIEGLPTLKKEANLKAWMYKIAHHTVVNFYRKKKIKSLIFSQFPYLKILAQEMQQPEFELEKAEIKVRLQIAFEKLSQKYQQILHMHYIDELPVKIISVELNLSFKATESLLYRARQQFIKYYETE
ncbi:MAG TPA: sigma-70 family RNA polymerase sigma factor [Candidatus Saccharimonadales bacterium]|nr:sigma-70 family RNA polymerase sigma factor [Candidatus Saccharimonadales bacterium]